VNYRLLVGSSEVIKTEVVVIDLHLVVSIPLKVIIVLLLIVHCLSGPLSYIVLLLCAYYSIVKLMIIHTHDVCQDN